ncbi:hypothetical protein C7C46_00930 [Streptomyces tateyamensis]|uniref:Uncharacterized protein n=1 Tax=Streptomyces tateyamensis TaxID=565073 RepID=A0A2V4NPA7_9ACTN|nr:hypothetical protein [Streptomyces tateyamensis]PYC88244.1 hypothetical protein C7C46_00930 [Streptomyces tateyamensis]
MVTPSPACPDCGAPLPAEFTTACPQCALPLTGAAAGALWQVTLALHGVERHRAELLRQQAELLAALRAQRDTRQSGPARPPASPRWAPPPVAPGWAPPAGWAAPSGWTTPGSRAAEVSGRSAQTVLLVLGGLLVGIAALVFTVVNWGSLGLAGRAAVLLAVTGCALALPPLLRRRGLTATAEAAGTIGLALLLLDAYAARAGGLAGLGSLDGAGYWAGATAVVGLGGLGYGWWLRLRLPLVLGFLAIRAVLPLALLSAGVVDFQAYATALVATSVLDALLLLLANRAAARTRLGSRAPERFALVVAVGWALLGGLVAAGAAVFTDRLAEAAVSWVPLGLLALLAGTVAVRLRDRGERAWPVGAAAVAGLALVAAGGGTLRLPLGAHWAAVGYQLTGSALVLVTVPLLHRTDPRLRGLPGLGAVGALTALAAALAALTGLGPALRAPTVQAGRVWGQHLSGSWAWPVDGAALTGLALLAALLAVVTVLRIPGAASGWPAAGTAVVAVPVLALLPAMFGLPYALAVAVALLLVLAAAAGLLLRPGHPAAVAMLLTALVLALDWASADRTASLLTLALCTLLGATLAWRLRASAQLAPSAAVGTVLALATTALAATDTAGLSAPVVLLTVLAVALATAPAAARLAQLAALSRAVECTGYGLAALALALLTAHPEPLVLGLAAGAVTALGVALRADRRPGAGYVGAGLALLACWVQLALWHVHSPEPYSLPLAAAALLVGRAHARRDPAPSWTTDGPGLAAALLPSLPALWLADSSHWLRPLLLGTAALAVTVLGVRLRRQAPLLLGGTALLLTAAHELAPTVLHALGLLPRWIPLATAGLLLLTLGARYEQRLRDMRRLGQTLRQFS